MVYIQTHSPRFFIQINSKYNIKRKLSENYTVSNISYAYSYNNKNRMNGNRKLRATLNFNSNTSRNNHNFHAEKTKLRNTFFFIH